MKEITLKAEKRDRLGTRGARQYRKSARVPVNLSKKGDASLALLVAERDLRKLVESGQKLVALEIGGARETALVKDVQFDALLEHLLHADFVHVDLTKEVKVQVEVLVKGKPVGVSEQGGNLIQYTRTIEVECLPTAIPERLEVDVSGLSIGEVCFAKDVKPPAGVKVTQEPETVICGVEAPHVEEAAPVAEVAPAPTEPELIRKERKPEEGEEEAAEAKPKEKEKEKAEPKEKEKKK